MPRVLLLFCSQPNGHSEVCSNLEEDSEAAGERGEKRGEEGRGEGRERGGKEEGRGRERELRREGRVSR